MGILDNGPFPKSPKHLVKTITETLLFIQVPYCLVVSDEKIKVNDGCQKMAIDHKYLAIFLWFSVINFQYLASFKKMTLYKLLYNYNLFEICPVWYHKVNSRKNIGFVFLVSHAVVNFCNNVDNCMPL